MAARKRAAKTAMGFVDDETTELANLPPIERPKTATEERREAELEDLLEEVGTDGRIKVWHIIDGRAAYAGEMSSDGFSLDVLMETYGGGDKTITIFQGRTKKETLKITLDPSIPPRNPRSVRMAASPSNGSTSVPELANVFSAMATSQMQQAQTMSTMMTGMIGAMATMMTASQSGRSDKDPTDTALKMVEILNANRNGSAPDADAMFKVLERGMNIGKAISGKDDGDGVMGVVGEGVKVLGSLVDGIVTAQKAKAASIASSNPAAPAGRRMLPVSPTPQDAPGDNGVSATQDPGGVTEMGVVPRRENAVEHSGSIRPWVDAASPHIGQLFRFAAFMPPDAAAATIAANLDDDQFDDLMNDIHDQTSPGFGVRLLGYFDDAKSVDPEWIGAVVADLLTNYTDEGSDGDGTESSSTETGTKEA